MTRKVIIDCDPGHDDIMAILSCLANPEEIEILGYTTVCGNNLVNQVTRNLCSVLTHLGIEGKVAVGYQEPILLKPEPQDAHGVTGLDGPVLPEPKVVPIEEHALEFMRQCLEENDKVTIIALAPLTNVAMLLKTYPHLKEKIECITIMGGSLYSGNIIERAEFNLYADPHAAKIVFEAGVPLVLSAIEICNEVSIRHSEIDALKGQGYVSDLAHDLLQFFSEWGRKRNYTTSPIFDLVPVMHLLHPELFEAKMCPVHIVTHGSYTRGMSVVNEQESDPEKCNTLVLMHGDRDKFIEYFIEDLKQLDKNYKK